MREDELLSSFNASEKYSEQFFEPFAEYERLDANQPSPQLPDDYPKVADGTLSAMLDERPMRVWGQLQTGRVVALPTKYVDFKEWKTELTDIYWKNKIIPNANTQAPFFKKLRIASRKSDTYGSQPLFAFPIARDSYIGADFTLPYIKDVLVEPGKVSDLDCDFIWLNQHYTKLQIRNILRTAGKVPGNAGWDMNALKKIYDSDEFSDRTNDNRHSDQKNIDMGETVTLSTCFMRGFQSAWMTIHCSGTGATVVRRRTNPNLDGSIPIIFFYGKQNLINPYGVSQMEIAGPNQNMVDLATAGHAKQMLIANDPPMQVAGDVESSGIDLDSLVMAPSNIMFTGDNQVSWFTPDKTILQSFSGATGPYKTNVMNLVGSNDASVSGQISGNSTYSKVPASVNFQKERMAARDNAARQDADEVLGRLAKLMINTAIQNSEGSDVIEITEEQRERLTSFSYEVPEGATKIMAEFDELKDMQFDFVVDAGSSKLEEDDATKQRISEAIDRVMSIPGLNESLMQEGKRLHLSQLVTMYFEKSGLDDVEKIITDVSPDEQQAIMQQAQAAQLQQEPQVDEPTDIEQEPMQQPEVQPQAMSDDEMVANALRQSGWSDEQIEEYLTRMRSI